MKKSNRGPDGKSRRRRSRVLLLSLAVAAVFLFLALRGADRQGMSRTFRQGQTRYLGLSSLAPFTPGNIGVYQFVAVAVLMPFGFLRDQALVYIFSFQAVIYVVVLWGVTGFWRLRLRGPLADPQVVLVPEGGGRDAP